MVPGLTMCGSVVELHGTESSFSTLGCVIKIDLEFYAITSMHAFRLLEPMKKLHSGEISHHRSADRSGACTSADEVAELPVYDEEPLYGSDTDSSDAMMEDGDYFIDDVEYESLAEDEEEEIDPVDSRSTVANDSYGNQTQTSGQMRDVKEMLALFPTPHELDESGELDLDWALIKLVDQQDWRPNAFVYPSISSSPVFLSKVDESQPTQETPVFIITSETTPQRGMLQPGTSLLGGINGRTPSTMWTVVLSEQNSLKRGDSGSIVVDATTNTIYGHVVGSNPIGEIYISPYAAVLEQIQHRFPGSTVAIPEPISTLACLVDFYTMLVRDERSLESLRRLEEAYRKAAAGLDEVERISPRIFQPHSSDAAAGVSGDEESPSMLYGIKAYDEVCSQLAQTTRELQDKKQDITGLQVDIGELKKEKDTAFRMFQDVFKTWDADKNLHASAPPAGASTVALPTTEHSNRAIPYSTSYITAAPATTATTSTTIPAIATALGSMATPGFLPPHALRSVMPASTHYPSSMLFGREASKPVGTPCSHSSSLMVRVLIRRLPLNTSEESLRLMVVWSKELADVELLPVEQSEDAGFRSALLRFHTMTGAHEAINMLDGRSNISNDAEMIVEILDSSPISARRYPTDTGSANPSSSASSTASSGPLSRQTSRFNSAFQSLESTSPPVNGVYPGHELPNPDMSLHYQNLFSPRPPIGNYLMSGKPLIAHDSIDDDETSDLLKDPVAYAEHLSTSQRRATAPQIPISRMAGLTLNTNKPPTSSPGVASPTSSQHYQRQTIPPVNPADQNPPCNTLYVGNLPIDTSEEELKAMFSKQRGYKRLCFRTKQNGPICFVEFEDVSFATKALHELYGQPLHNSVKGGIRLSFSKNPLGVRSGQALGQNNAAAIAGMNGLGSGRGIYHGTSKALNAGHGHPYAVANFPGAANNGCGGPVYGGQMAAPPNSVLNNAPG
ncbi:unnamed protein product [Clonostachys rhizophaga]|uniref:RRM domain-containing protein n=1 Tax=Clonostachys rhizophaga TaxID=160324 RepID=A0A9N9VB21_9HYPO|nr:unnamed protein product [Clonostachys rhizophaga]